MLLFDPEANRLLSVIPTRFFLGRPAIGEEMHIEIEKGKTLILRLLAVGPVIEGKGIRDVWFEVNGEVGAFALLPSNKPDAHALRFALCQSKTLLRQSTPYPGRRLVLTLAQSARPCPVSLWRYV